MIINLAGTLTIISRQLAQINVILKPGEVVCDQNITLLRWATAGVAVLGVIFLLWVVWCNSAAEVGLSGLSRQHLQSLKERYARRGEILDELIERSMAVGSVLHLMNTVCLIGATALIITAIHQFNLYGIEVTFFILIFIFLALTFAHALPKGFAHNDPAKAAIKYSKFVKRETTLLYPLVKLVNHIVNAILQREKLKLLPENSIVTREEVMLLANLSQEEGIIEEESSEMIRSIFQFSDKVVREVMFPRLDIQALPVKANLEQTMDMIIQSGKSRLPVYDSDIDHIRGVVYAKDLFKFMLQQPRPPFDLLQLARPPYYIPGSKKVDVLFAEMRKSRVHIAIIVDEYGGTAGLVTIEDLLEEIVGEIQDEYDAETAEFERVSDNEVLVEARLMLSEVNELFGTAWESPDIDTIGGFVSEKLNRLPVEGEALLVDRLGNSVQIQPNGQALNLPEDEETEPAYVPIYYRLTVIKTTGHRLRQLRLQQIFAVYPPERERAEEPNQTETRRSKTASKLLEN